MSTDKSCSHLVNQVMAWLASQEGAEFSSDTSAYTQARQRLPEKAIAQLVRQSGHQLDEQVESHLQWKGHRVKVFDGSTA